MKTKNNVQKTILRSAAVIVSFVLITFTVSAQDFWKKLLTNSSFNEIALAMAETSKKPNLPAKAESNVSDNFIWNTSEESLELENWMTNNHYFYIPVYYFNEVLENNLSLEDWMLNEALFNVNNEKEEALKLESWMTSDNVWKM
jgi:hypothetical protein